MGKSASIAPNTNTVFIEIGSDLRFNLFDKLSMQLEELVAPVLHGTMLLGSLLLG